MQGLDFSTSTIIGGMIFSSIGLAAFVYGKKQALAKPMVIGILLMAYPFFFSDTLLLYGIGVGLTALLFIFN